MKLIFLGPPGAGKGSVAKEIIKEKNLIQISTGNLIRNAITKSSEIGQKAKEYYGQGKLVPDEIIIDLLKERISQDDCSKGFILDGFPRTISQAETLDNEIKIDKVINFKVTEEEIFNRLASRIICRNCGQIYNLIRHPPKEKGKCNLCQGELYQRDDDTKETVKKRLEIYRKETSPLIEFYSQKGILNNIDANETILKSLNETLEIIKFSLG